MQLQLVALLPVLAALAPALAVPNMQARSLAYPMAPPLKHRDVLITNGRSRKIKRACKATTPEGSSNSTSPVGSASGTASAPVIASSAAVALPSSLGNSTIPASSAASAAPSASSAAGNSTSGGASLDGKAALTPNGIKAGMTLCNGIDEFSGKLGWCYDWTPSPSPPAGVEGASMLWGDGSLGADQDDAARVSAFKALTTTPKYVIGFEEPDCSTPGSAAMTVDATATAWNELIAPYGAKGSLLISPSMCHQADETFLTPFKEQITTDWDVTNLHINKKDMDGVNKDLDHYWNTYNKPMWVTVFACVEDQSWTPCTDQAEINQFINDIVALFEKDPRVYAYAYSNGIGLGDAWPAIVNGQLTDSGKAYLSAVSQYH